MTLETFPRYSEINNYMKRISGRVCSSYSSEHVNNQYNDYDNRIAAYDFSGCDYALVLFASFPSHCVNLQQLNWSLSPLPGQECTNLLIFCDAALSLHLPNTPEASLTPNHLQRSVDNTLHHMQVQHWLFTLSQRFPPLANFNPYNTRSWLRWKQTGEPFIVQTPFNELYVQENLEESLEELSNATTSSHNLKVKSVPTCVMKLLINDEHTACNALAMTSPYTRDELHKAAAFLMHIPEENDVPIKLVAHNEMASIDKAKAENKLLGKDKLRSEKNDDSDSNTALGKEVRSREYAKPWRQASLSTNSKYRKDTIVTICTTRNTLNANKKRVREEHEPNSTLCPCSYLTAYIPLAHNLHEQCVWAEREVAMLHSRLETCFNLFYRQLLNVGNDRVANVIEYDVIAKQLQEIDLGNSQTIM